MPIVENTADRLVLKSGSATLALDKKTKKVVFQRAGLLWKPKPMEAELSAVTDVTLDAGLDRASGVEICNSMLVMKDGVGWAFGANDKAEAQSNIALIKKFLGLA
jgi:hypothetical protein